MSSPLDENEIRVALHRQSGRERETVCALQPHPDHHCDAVKAITVSVRRAGGNLVIRYTLTGALERLAIPQPGPPRAADRLWQHTCFEIFMRCAGRTEYHELNFAPSCAWALYAFRAYRDGGRIDAPDCAPRLDVRRTASELRLEATLDLAALSPAYESGPLRVGFSAVVEAADGKLSYWALAHAEGKPDFHHPKAFALVIP